MYIKMIIISKIHDDNKFQKRILTALDRVSVPPEAAFARQRHLVTSGVNSARQREAKLPESNVVCGINTQH